MRKERKLWKAGLILLMGAMLFTGCRRAGVEDYIANLNEPADENYGIEKEILDTARKEEELYQKSLQKKVEGDNLSGKELEEKFDSMGMFETTEEEEDDQEKLIQDESEKLSGQLKKIVKDCVSNGTFSAYTSALDSEAKGTYQNRRMQAASLIKLYIAGTVYENWKSVTKENSVEEVNSLLKLMITVSDNDAANSLIRLLGKGEEKAGMDKVNAFCIKHKYEDTHIGRMLLASNDEDDNYTSVLDCGNFLRDICQNKIKKSDSLIKLLKKQERTGKIPAGVPKGVETGNKTGELADVENDAAIVWGETPYILVVMSEEITAPGNAQQSIVKISAKVYDMWEN